MKLDDIGVTATLARIEQTLAHESDLPPSLCALIELLVVIIRLLLARLGVNSTNSSTPPSADPNRRRGARRNRSQRRPGGQPGHTGTTLARIDDPDEVVTLTLDPQTLPQGQNWRRDGLETRQVFDLVIQRHVTEYRAEVWVTAAGQRRVAAFPAHVGARVQYGPTCKAHAVYLSQYQLLPYERVCELFADQLGLPLSAGTLARFNQEAGQRLVPFEQALKAQPGRAAC